MMQAHYPLQALLYSVAVHRMLRWRQPGVRPAAPPRWRAVPLRPRDGRAADPAGRRRALRRLQLAAARGAGGRAVRPAGRGAAVRAAAEQAAGSDVLLAYGTTGLLAAFNAAGVLDAPDVRTAQTIGRIGREPEERVVLALALAVRALRSGSVCIDLRTVSTLAFDESEAGIDLSSLPWPDPDGVAGPGGGQRPRRRRLRSTGRPPAAAGQRPALPRALLAPGGAGPPGSSSTASSPNRRTSIANGSRPRSTGSSREPDAAQSTDRQQLAAAVSALGRVTVIAGGPGTGKTTTVARLLALLTDQPGPPPRIALAAPTGKAAARLAEAVRGGGLEARRPRIVSGSATSRRRRCTGCSAGCPGRGRGSAMTRTTSCPTTW